MYSLLKGDNNSDLPPPQGSLCTTNYNLGTQKKFASIRIGITAVQPLSETSPVLLCFLFPATSRAKNIFLFWTWLSNLPSTELCVYFRFKYSLMSRWLAVTGELNLFMISW